MSGRIRRLLAHRRAVLGGCALLAAAMLPGVSRLGSDNSAEVFFLRGSPRVEEYHRFQREFGGDEAVRVLVTGEGLWTRPGLEWLERLEEQAAELPGVAAARGLAGLYRPSLLGWPPADAPAFRRELLAEPEASLARDLGLVGGEGEAATVLAVLASGRTEGATVENLRRLIATPPPGVEARLAGMPMLDRALDASSREIQLRFFPLLVLFALILLGAAFHSAGGVVVPVVYVGFCELLLLGAMGYAGTRLNLVMAVLPPLVFAIATATAVHLLTAFRDHHRRGLDAAGAVIETYRDKGWAVLWTGVTTLVGFAALATSRVGPVRSLGLWSAWGIAAMTAAAFLLYPALLASLESHRGERRDRFERALARVGRRLAEQAAARRRGVVLTALALAALALAGLPRLEVESNALRYLAARHPARAAIEELERRGVGAAAVELLVTLPGGDFRDPETLASLARLASRLRREEAVHGVLSAAEVVEEAVRRNPAAALFGTEATRAMVLQRMLEDGELASLLGADGATARLTLFTEVLGREGLEPLEEQALAAARRTFPRARARLTGSYPLLVATQGYLLRTLALSLGLTFLCVAVILRLLLPSTRLALLALVPNLWPIAGVLGAMGWLGIPLDVATVMVASIALGLVVDDTIHTLGHFRELAPRLGRLEAVAGTLQRTAPAYVLTGLILAAGFGVCGLSDFAPTARFGLLSAAAVTLAVIGDLLLLPALLGGTPHAVVERMARARE